MHYPVHHRVLTWTTSLDDEPFSCDVHVYDSINSSSDSPPVLNLNGIGESSYSAAVAPTILGENVISPILPLQSELALTPKRVEAMADEVIKLIVDDALARINQGRPTNKAHHCAVRSRKASQAVPMHRAGYAIRPQSTSAGQHHETTQGAS